MGAMLAKRAQRDGKHAHDKHTHDKRGHGTQRRQPALQLEIDQLIQHPHHALAEGLRGGLDLSAAA